MLRFYAGLFAIGCRDLASHIGLLISLVVDGHGEDRLGRYDSTKDGILKTFDAVLQHPEEWPIGQALTRKMGRIRERIASEEILTVSMAVIILKELLNDIVEHVGGPWFLMIPAARRRFYEQRAPLFGHEVDSAFPEASGDISAAGRCLALDEWTATVFHLMRVLERGLHRLATDLEVGMNGELELENWKNVIDQIEKKIRSMEQLPKSPEKSERLRTYSEMAANFWFFKEAWRNHVSHARATYDERSAINVFNHVEQFMQQIAQSTNGGIQ